MKNSKTVSIFMALNILLTPWISAMKPFKNPDDAYKIPIAPQSSDLSISGYVPTEIGNQGWVNGNVEPANKRARQASASCSIGGQMQRMCVITQPAWASANVDRPHGTRLSPDLRLGHSREEQAYNISQSLQLCVAKESLDGAIEKIRADFECGASAIDVDIISAVDTVMSYAQIPHCDAALRQFLHRQLLLIESILATHSYSNYMVNLKISEIKSHLGSI